MKPSIRSSPGTRGAPQVGFSVAITPVATLSQWAVHKCWVSFSRMPSMIAFKRLSSSLPAAGVLSPPAIQTMLVKLR